MDSKLVRGDVSRWDYQIIASPHNDNSALVYYLLDGEEAGRRNFSPLDGESSFDLAKRQMMKERRHEIDVAASCCQREEARQRYKRAQSLVPGREDKV